MNFNTYLATVFFILFVRSAIWGMNHRNFSLIEENGDREYELGCDFMLDAKYDSAAYCFNQAFHLYQRHKNWDNTILSLRQAATVECYLANFDKAINHLTNAIRIGSREEILSEDYGLANTLLGGIFRLKGNINESITFHKKAIDIFENLEIPQIYSAARSYMDLGAIELREGNYRTAITMYERALSSLHKGTNKDNLIGLSYNMCAIAHDRSDSYYIALDFFKKAVNVWRKSGSSRNLASGLHNIALAHYRLGNIKESKNYSNLAESQLGLFLDDVGNLSDHHLLKGAIFLHEDLLDSAFYYFKLSFQQNIQFQNEFSHQQAKIYEYLGRIHNRYENFTLSNSYYTKCLNLRKKLLGEQHKEVASTYNNLASNSYLVGEYDRAIDLFEKAITSNTIKYIDQKPFINTILKKQIHGHHIYIRSAFGISNANEELAEVSKDIEYIYKAYTVVNSALPSIEKALHQQLKYEDKLQLSKTISQIYESAIRVSLKLYNHTQEEKYKLQAFYFSEKSKAGVLTEALTNMSAKSFGILPDSVIALEKEIKIDQNYYQTKIQNEKVKLDGYDTLEVARWEDKLFTLNRQSDSLVLALEKNYPRYHELKYQSNILSAEDVQRKLNSNEVLLEYFVGEEQTYLFRLTQNTYNIHTIENVSSRQDQIINFRKNLQASILGDKAYKEMYATQAYDIYKDLLKPALADLDSGINKLIIIPDADLGYIPFDILVTENMTGKKLSYQDLPYLLKSYQTQYGYSASLLFNDFERKQKNFERQFLAFAPQYENVEIDSVRGLSLGKFRDQVTSLKYNTPEVNSISEYMDGLTFTGAEAREEAFKNYAGNSSILHLAMHAFVDDNNPMNSKLVFTQSSDSTEDNFLHAYELYNMELPAELAVLSACETGFGKLEKGEGIMSLARAFSYAGCPSVVMSHWSVNDAATAKLMGYFYKYLSEGLEKDAALQQAKLEFLQNAGPVQANPFFWGSFVVMGNTDPIEMVKSDWVKWYYLVGILLVLGVMGIVWRRRGFREV